MSTIDFAALLKAERAKFKATKTRKEFLKKRNKLNIDDYKVGNIPNVYYINEFITKEEEKILISEIYSPITQKNKKWAKLANRRLQNWGGIPHPEAMIEEPLPPFLESVGNAIKQSGFASKFGNFNQVLLNEYLNGKGISAHKDGELYHSFAAVLSLESSAIIEFYKRRPSKKENDYDECCVQSLVLQPRSLLVFEASAYDDYFHGLRDTMMETVQENCVNCNFANVKVGDLIKREKRRLSLTIRRCKKTKERIFSLTEEEELKRRENWWYSSINDSDDKFV